MRILVVGDPHGKLIGKIPKDIDLIIITGDLGKSDLARKLAFRNIERRKKGLPELKETRGKIKKELFEVYDSAIKVAKFYSGIAPTYSIMGNVWNNDEGIKKDEKKYRIKLPYLNRDLRKIRNFSLVKNNIRNIRGLKIGFLEYFIDKSWIKEFGEKQEKKTGVASAETNKAKKILKRFGKVDILVCHQPPYGILDKVTAKFAPKHWKGKHAGSKVILDYIKKYQPKYVFCGHIHEGKGKKNIGKTEVINAGCCEDYFTVEIK